MKVFISWSGDLSKQIAGAISHWLPRAMHAVTPYYSPDMGKGKRWAVDLATALKDCKVGLIVLCPDNYQSSWINFEAGALSREFSESRVCPVLFGLRSDDIDGPLTQFQASRFTKEDFRKVLRSINEALEENALSEVILSDTYDKWWPDLESAVTKILEVAPVPSSPNASDREVLLIELNDLRHQYEEGQRQTHLLAAAVTELREVITSNNAAGTPNEALDLTGIWIDTAFGGQTKVAALIGEYLIFTYASPWPGAYFGTVRDKMFRFSWTRFDKSLQGKGYMRVNDSADQMQGGIWFDDTDVETMLTRDIYLEHHALSKTSAHIDSDAQSLVDQARDFLRNHQLINVCLTIACTGSVVASVF